MNESDRRPRPADGENRPRLGRLLSLAWPLATVVLVISSAVFQGLGQEVGFLSGVDWTGAYWWFALGSVVVALGPSYWLLDHGIDVTRSLWTGVAVSVVVAFAAMAVGTVLGRWSDPLVEAATTCVVAAVALAVGFRGRLEDLRRAVREDVAGRDG